MLTYFQNSLTDIIIIIIIIIIIKDIYIAPFRHAPKALIGLYSAVNLKLRDR